MKFCFTSAKLSVHFANFFALFFFRNLDGHFEQGIKGHAFLSSYLRLQISKISVETCFISGQTDVLDMLLITEGSSLLGY